MNLDATTLMVMSSLVVVLCGVSFILNTSFNRNDPPERMWSLAFIGGISAAAGFGIDLYAPQAWWGLVVANVALVAAVGALWSGARLFNDRSSMFWVVALVGGIVCIVTIVRGPIDGAWSGAAVLWFGLAGLGIAGGIESMRGRLRRNLNGRTLGLVLWIYAAFLIARAIVLIAEGPHGPTFVMYFGIGVASALNMGLIVIASIAISVLRVEHGGDRAVGDFTDGIHSKAGVLSASAFRQAAGDHVERAGLAQLGLVLIGADIDKLPEVNTAFGRLAGDEAISHFAQTLRRVAPPMAVLGHPAAGRFYILSGAGSATEALTITERIQNALVDEPMSESQQIRLTASFGVADTYDHGHDLDALISAVADAIDRGKLAGGNHIEVSSVGS